MYEPPSQLKEGTNSPSRQEVAHTRNVAEREMFDSPGVNCSEEGGNVCEEGGKKPVGEFFGRGNLYDV